MPEPVVAVTYRAPAPVTVQDIAGNIYVNGTEVKVADVAGLPAKHPKTYKGQP